MHKMPWLKRGENVKRHFLIGEGRMLWVIYRCVGTYRYHPSNNIVTRFWWPNNFTALVYQKLNLSFLLFQTLYFVRITWWNRKVSKPCPIVEVAFLLWNEWHDILMLNSSEKWREKHWVSDYSITCIKCHFLCSHLSKKTSKKITLMQSKFLSVWNQVT